MALYGCLSSLWVYYLTKRKEEREREREIINIFLFATKKLEQKVFSVDAAI